MSSIVLFFLIFSLLFYLIFGGADFGAGILQLFTRSSGKKRMQDLTYQALGPVWEANHIWLILLVVILFVAFPKMYALLSIHLHIPLMLMLLGIILRGTMFIFQHYDAIEDHSQVWYARLFEWSSLITPFFLGMILGGTMGGGIDLAATDFWGAYLAPWINVFSIWLGVFFCALAAFVAAIFLTLETEDPVEQRRLGRRSQRANLVLVAIGGMGLVLEVLDLTQVPVLSRYLGDVPGMLVLAVGTLLLLATSYLLRREQYWWARVTGIGQVAVILLGWLWAQYPVLMSFQDGSSLRISDALAPEATIYYMGWALIGGSLLILPALFYLFWAFKKKEPEPVIEKQ